MIRSTAEEGTRRPWLRVTRLAAPARGADETNQGWLTGVDRDRLSPSYDLFIGAIGYESRGRFIHGWLGSDRCPRSLALAFDVQTEGAYDQNLRYFEIAGSIIERVAVREVEQAVNDACDEIVEGDGLLTLALDVSVLDRTRIASVLLALADRRVPMDVDVFYAPAMYEDPPEEEPPLIVHDPVHERFSGWSRDPSLPVELVVGLGYEREKAVGSVEFLEPARTWAFVPHGVDGRYDKAVLSANAAFFSLHPPDLRLDYHVLDPFGCFEVLESLVFGLSAGGRPVLVPFGPKVFSAVCMCVALVHAPDVAVWRFSSSHLSTPVDRQAEGSVAGFRVCLRP